MTNEDICNGLKIKALYNDSITDSVIFSYKIDFFELTFDKKTKKLITLQANIVFQRIIDEPLLDVWKSINDNLIVGLGSPNRVGTEDSTLSWYGKSTHMITQIVPQEMKLDEEGKIKGITRIVFTVLNPIAVKKISKQGF